MLRSLLKVLVIVGVFWAGLFLGRRLGPEETSLSLAALKGTLPPLSRPSQFDWKSLPPLAVRAQGLISPQTGDLSLDTLFVSTPTAGDFEADVHVGGTWEKPTWAVRSLKKKHVRLRFEL